MKLLFDITDTNRYHFRKCDMFGLGTAIAGTLGLVGSAMQSKYNYQSAVETNQTNLQMNRETNEANRRLSELAYRQNLEQWNRENAYNSPAATMARFQAAGLNPNLAYNQSNNAASSPTMSYAPMKAAKLDAPKIDLAGVLNSLQVLGGAFDQIMESQTKVS